MCDQAKLLGRITKRINAAYEEYARSLGFSYTSLLILHIVYLSEHATQKEISEETFLPKQTVNSAINQFVKKGIMRLEESNKDRRSKEIRLSEDGRKLADSILPKISQAEEDAMEVFGKQERSLFLSRMEEYAITLNGILNDGKERKKK